jgi:WhiB family redox-sensing transcriptional regulator
MAPMQWRDATVSGMAETRTARQEPDVSQVIDQFGYGGQVGFGEQFGTASAVPVGLDLPCTEDPELFFAESPSDVEQAKAMCRGCPARLACLTGALERREPWGVWGGELLLRGTIVPRKRPRGRPRKTEHGDQAEQARQPEKTDVAA